MFTSIGKHRKVRMKLNEALALRVKELCKEHRLTPHGLSIRSGVASSTVDNIIKMRSESVQLKFIYAICDGLDMSLEEFFASPYFQKGSLTD